MNHQEKETLESIRDMQVVWDFAVKGTLPLPKDSRTINRTKSWPNRLAAGSDRCTSETTFLLMVEEMATALESNGFEVDLFARRQLESNISNLYNAVDFPYPDLCICITFDWRKDPDNKGKARVANQISLSYNDEQTTYPALWFTNV